MSYFKKYIKYKNKFLNLRKQIEEFNIINEDRKIEDFIDPINKNKYTLLKESIFKGYSIERDSNESLTPNKNKFLNLRKQIEAIKDSGNPINLQKGGNKYDMLLDTLIKNKKAVIIIGALRPDFNPDDYKDKLIIIGELIKEGMIKNDETVRGRRDDFGDFASSYNVNLARYIEKNIQDVNNKNKLLEYLGIIESKNCTIDEIMSYRGSDLAHCMNFVKDVKGSCGDPAFASSDTNSDISENTKNNYLKLFDIVETFIKNPENNIIGINIYMGSECGTTLTENYINIFIEPRCSSFPTFEDAISQIETAKIIEIIKIKNYFPLAYNFPNSKLVLDKILELNKIKPVNIFNAMCGTCHRSLYYLVKKGINSYKMNAGQGTNKDDTYDILTCFKDYKKKLNNT